MIFDRTSFEFSKFANSWTRSSSRPRAFRNLQQMNVIFLCTFRNIYYGEICVNVRPKNIVRICAPQKSTLYIAHDARDSEHVNPFK